MSPALVCHGWQIAFQPRLFARQYAELKAEVRTLKQELEPHVFVVHPQVKLLAAVMAGIKERIAADPYASRFALQGPLRRYGRLKGLGLPDRHRLFFRPFEADGRRLLLILTPPSRAWFAAAIVRKAGQSCRLESRRVERLALFPGPKRWPWGCCDRQRGRAGCWEVPARKN